MSFVEWFIIKFEKLAHLWNPASFNEVNMVRMFVIALVILSGRELHGKSEVIHVLFACLPECFKILDCWNGCKLSGGLKKVTFGL